LRGGAAQRGRGNFSQNRLINRTNGCILSPPAFNKRSVLWMVQQMFLNATTLIGIQNSVYEGVKIRFFNKT
jgi:hypothetical protein